MKIIFWNTYHGFGKSTESMLPPMVRKQRFASWIAKQNPDIVALLEARDFQHTTYGIYAAHWGHSHILLNTGSFPIALSSQSIIRQPICHHQNMTNGFIMATIGDISLFLTHIPPQQYADRQAESREMLSQLIYLIKQEKAFLFLGDLNATSTEPLPQALQAIGMRMIGLDTGVDYAMCSPSFQVNDLSIQQPESPELEQLSDHWPLIIEWSEDAT